MLACAFSFLLICVVFPCLFWSFTVLLQFPPNVHLLPSFLVRLHMDLLTCVFSVLFIRVFLLFWAALHVLRLFFGSGMSTRSLYRVWVVRVCKVHNAFPLIQKFQGGPVDLRVTRTYNVLDVGNAYNTKIQTFQGGRSSYKLVTCNVFKVHDAYNTKIQTQKFQGGRSRYKRL